MPPCVHITEKRASSRCVEIKPHGFTGAGQQQSKVQSPMTSEVLAEVLAGTPAKAKQSDSALGTVVMYRSGELQKLHTEQDSQYYCEFVILNWSSAPESFFVQLDGAVSCLHCVGW